MLTLKTTHFQRQPWRSFAIGHKYFAVAAKALRETLESDHQHPRVAALKTHPLRSQAERWLQTGKLAHDDFAVYVMKSRMPWTVERKIEGEHARLKRALKNAHSHSEPYASLNYRYQGMHDECQRSRDFMKDLCQHARLATTPWAVVTRLGFRNHPPCQQAKGDLQTRIHHPDLVRPVY